METRALERTAARKSTTAVAAAPGPVYDTPEKIRAMPPCRAVPLQRRPCTLYLKTQDGKGFYIGSPGMDAEVGHFLRELKDGESYAFPDVFIKYQKQRLGKGSNVRTPQ